MNSICLGLSYELDIVILIIYLSAQVDYCHVQVEHVVAGEWQLGNNYCVSHLTCYSLPVL